MTSEALDDWLRELEKKVQQFSIVFLQLGHPMQQARSRVLQLPGLHIDASEFLNTKTLNTVGPIFLHSLEALAGNRGDRLGKLREQTMVAATSGHCVALVSTIPKTAYPDTVGSDVVADAKQVFAPVPIETEHGTAIEFDTEYFLSCLKEMGDRTLIALADALWEGQLSPNEALAVLSRPDIEALRGAGLVDAVSATLSWRIGDGFKQFRLAVAIASSECISAHSSVPDTFSELWILERMIRNMVRRALIARMGEGWRHSCLGPNLGAEVLDRARRDSQPRAERLSDLRDPLEWLTTTELLDVKDSRELGGLGMEPYLWGKLRTEIVPIRNKVAHMRMVSESDSRRASTWRKLVARHAD